MPNTTQQSNPELNKQSMGGNETQNPGSLEDYLIQFLNHLFKMPAADQYASGCTTGCGTTGAPGTNCPL